MRHILCISLGLLMLLTRAIAQPAFELLRLDPAQDYSFYFPTLEATNERTLRCGWSSNSLDSVGAYSQQVDFSGGLIGGTDTLIFESYELSGCLPQVETCGLPSGAWVRLIGHS